jgi:hypothetical protein
VYQSRRVFKRSLTTIAHSSNPAAGMRGVA